MAKTVLQLEKKQYDFLDKSYDFTRPFIYRINVNGKRYYYEIDHETNRPVIYASGTTIISDGYPDASKGMEEWRVKMRVMGKDPDEYAKYRADYGTIMHVLFGHYLMKEPINLEKLDEYILSLDNLYIDEQRVKELVDNNIDEFRKDLLSFAQWVNDYNVKPIAIEMMLRSKKYKVATAVDLICKLTVSVKGFHGEVYKSGARKGEQKETKKDFEIIAIVDFKSGKNGFYPKHALQLELNKRMVEENFGDKIKVEKIFNFSPKDWKTTPSFNFTDQSNNTVLDEFEEIMNIGGKRHDKKKKYVTNFNGVLKFGTEFDYKNNYKSIPLEEYIMEIDELNSN